MQFANEHALIPALKKGDQKAVQHWYTQSKKPLLRFFQAKVKNDLDAQELVHDTMLSCLSSLPLFRKESGLWGYMLAVARHELADYWRKQYAKKALTYLPFGEEIIQSLCAPEKRTEEESCTATLPSHVAELLSLRYIDKKPVKELAYLYGLSVSAMQSRITRAKELLKEEYEKAN